MTKVSGFVEWLPEQRRVELQWMDEIRRTFESYGFCSLYVSHSLCITW